MVGWNPWWYSLGEIGVLVVPWITSWSALLFCNLLFTWRDYSQCLVSVWWIYLILFWRKLLRTTARCGPSISSKQSLNDSEQLVIIMMRNDSEQLIIIMMSFEYEMAIICLILDTCNVSLIWVLLTKTAHLFYDNHSEHECSLPGQHGHVCWTIVNNLILNSFQSIMADHFWIRIHSMWICRFTWPKSFQ